MQQLQGSAKEMKRARTEYVSTTWEHFDEAKGDLFALHLARSPKMWDLLPCSHSLII